MKHKLKVFSLYFSINKVFREHSYKSVYLCFRLFETRKKKHENLRFAYNIHYVCSFEVDLKKMLPSTVSILYVVPDQVRSQNRIGNNHVHLETLPLVQMWLGVTGQENFFVKCMHVMFSCKKNWKLLWGFLMLSQWIREHIQQLLVILFHLFEPNFLLYWFESIEQTD